MSSASAVAALKPVVASTVATAAASSAKAHAIESMPTANPALAITSRAASRASSARADLRGTTSRAGGEPRADDGAVGGVEGVDLRPERGADRDSHRDADDERGHPEDERRPAASTAIAPCAARSSRSSSSGPSCTAGP